MCSWLRLCVCVPRTLRSPLFPSAAFIHNSSAVQDEKCPFLSVLTSLNMGETPSHAPAIPHASLCFEMRTPCVRMNINTHDPGGTARKCTGTWQKHTHAHTHTYIHRHTHSHTQIHRRTHTHLTLDIYSITPFVTFQRQSAFCAMECIHDYDEMPKCSRTFIMSTKLLLSAK